MLGESIASQSEVIRAIVSGSSPWRQQQRVGAVLRAYGATGVQGR